MGGGAVGLWPRLGVTAAVTLTLSAVAWVLCLVAGAGEATAGVVAGIITVVAVGLGAVWASQAGGGNDAVVAAGLQDDSRGLDGPTAGRPLAELQDGFTGRDDLPVPRELPADVSAFAGRTAELAELDRLLLAADVGAESAAVVISAVSGTAGVGKTALAVRWAHRVCNQFPDGQLYVNLRGYDPGQPMTAADALAGFLRSLGKAGQDIPAEPDDRAALYRSLLADRRILVVLDNACDVEQVRLLLPGTMACMVVVTSRDSLAGLVARHGATRMDLDLLPLPDAVALLRALIGGRVGADPGAAVTLAERCARLPLALRVAAELAAARPDVSLADLAGELTALQQRLDLLDAGGDPRTAVRAVFSWSYQHLGGDMARAFRLFGLHPGPDLDQYAAAALTATTVETAGHLLELLARAHLIQRTLTGRYGMHDLLRAYAAEQAVGDETEPDRQAALTRLFDHYLHTAAAAMNTLDPAEQDHRPRIPRPATPTPPVTDPAAARAWLDAERGTLVAVAGYTAAHGWPGYATRLAVTLHRYLDIGGYYAEAINVHTYALSAARQTGGRAGEAGALNNLGGFEWRLGHYQQAADYLQQALDRFRKTGDQAGEVGALTTLGAVYLNLGHYQQAADHLQQAVNLCRETGDRSREARALNNLGLVKERLGHYQQAASCFQQVVDWSREAGDRIVEARALGNLGLIDHRLGRYQEAADHQQQTLALFREAGDRGGEANTLANLGAAEERLSQCQEAAEHQQQALALFREIGNPGGQARALGNLGIVEQRLGRYQEAADYHQRALEWFRQTGDRGGEAEALNGLGETSLATGQQNQADAQHTAALSLASQIGDQYEQARAHNGLAEAHYAAGDLDQARHHWQEAFTQYTDLGAPEARNVHAHLTALNDPASVVKPVSE